MRLSIHSTAALLLAANLAVAQQPVPVIQNGATPAQLHQPTTGQRRRAAKLYLSAAKLYEAQKFEPALKQYEQAAALDPSNNDYPLAAAVARSHAVLALIQDAAKSRTQGDTSAARTTLLHAQQLDPKNEDVADHIRQFADTALVDMPSELEKAEQPRYRLGAPEQLEPTPGTHSFHLRMSPKQLIQQVYKTYGIDATVDDSIRGATARLDLDDASFSEAIHALSLLTDSFYSPIDPHRVLIARDTQQLRAQYQRNAMESVPLTGLSPNEMHDIQSLSRNIFDIQKTNLDEGAATLTVQAPASTLNAFNATWRDLAEGKPEVLIDVKVLQIAHSSEMNTGAQPPQTVTAFNVYAEEQSILNSNQSLVQQIISSGLASPGDTLAILGILLASGQVTSSLFSNGLALFGNGISTSGLSPGPTTINLNLNSSDSRELDDYQLRLDDGEEGTLKSGMRYPITTSSYSSLVSNTSGLSGLASAGNSSSLTGILASLGSAPNIPQVQYQDIGLTLKATPRVMRSGDVALTFDMKIASLQGTSLNDIPVLTDRSYTSVVTMRANEAVVVASELDASEIRAISGMPGLSEIPGLNNATDKDVQKSSSTLLIIMTPHVVRNPHHLGHSPMQIVESSSQTH